MGNGHKDLIIDKKSIVKAFLNVGMLIAYMGSLHPWFMWPFGNLYPIPAFCFIFVAVLFSHTMEHPVLNRTDWIPPVIACAILMAYSNAVTQGNLNSYVAIFFNIFIFMSLFRLEMELLEGVMVFLAKSMAWLLIFSMFFYFLYLFNFPLPYKDVDFNDMQYSYSNYYFFLLDDRFMNNLIPRFHSVFLEPSHLGVSTVLILMTQYGRWRKWYNIVLIIATVISFSLEAYVLLFIIVFLNLWIMNKKVIAKAFIALFFLGSIFVGSIFYNNGDNLINNLIMLRLDMEDGVMEGNNRVGKSFQKEFDEFIDSSDVFFGRAEKYDFKDEGNAGYQVYIYIYGFVGLLLVVNFYLISMKNASNYRLVLTALLIAVLDFIVRGYPLWYSVYIPIFCMSYSTYANRLQLSNR